MTSISAQNNPSHQAQLACVTSGNPLSHFLSQAGAEVFESISGLLNESDIQNLSNLSQAINNAVHRNIKQTLYPSLEGFVIIMNEIFSSQVHDTFRSDLQNAWRTINQTTDSAQQCQEIKKVKQIADQHLKQLSLNSLNSLVEKVAKRRFPQAEETSGNFLSIADFSPIYRRLEQIQVLKEQTEPLQSLTTDLHFRENISIASPRFVADLQSTVNYFNSGFYQAGFEAAKTFKRAKNRNQSILNMVDQICRKENPTTPELLQALEFSYHISEKRLREEAQCVIFQYKIYNEIPSTTAQFNQKYDQLLTLLQAFRFNPQTKRNNTAENKKLFKEQKAEFAMKVIKRGCEERAQFQDLNFTQSSKILMTNPDFGEDAIPLLRAKNFPALTTHITENFSPRWKLIIIDALVQFVVHDQSDLKNAFFTYYSKQPLLGCLLQRQTSSS